MAAASPSKPLLKPKAQKPGLCALCQGPFRTPVILRGQKFCRFCFSRLKKEALAKQPSPKDDKKGKGRTDKKEEIIPEEKGQELCGEHREQLTWFCIKEKVPICEVCKATEIHASHSVVPLEDAAQEYKAKLQQAVSLLEQNLEKSLELKYQEGKKTALWKGKVHNQKDLILTEFNKLFNFLDEEADRLLESLKQEERETLKKLHENLTQLSEQSSTLKQLVAEIKKKSQQPPAELLKDVESALSRTENVTLLKTEVIPTELKNIYHIPSLSITELLTKYKVDMSLDPATAHPSLVVSEDGKSVQYRGVRQELPDNMERFDTYTIVLGSKKFTSGKHYWEVEVGGSTEWDLGVCRESVSRKGQAFMLSPKSGFWRLWLRKGDQYKVLISCPTALPVSVKPTRVGIFLDYSEGEVSFYNVTEKSHMYTYIGAFYVPLRPFFSPSRHHKGEKADPLSICPARKQDTTRSKEARDKTQEFRR